MTVGIIFQPCLTTNVQDNIQDAAVMYDVPVSLLVCLWCKKRGFNQDNYTIEDPEGSKDKGMVGSWLGLLVCTYIVKQQEKERNMETDLLFLEIDALLIDLDDDDE
ncbi:hypothetical protein C8J56DRAFT_890395 [Mycena floridula]|nr:hypothetical protein C8J56DRAFT_890395 [Mycena floridula]